MSCELVNEQKNILGSRFKVLVDAKKIIDNLWEIKEKFPEGTTSYLRNSLRISYVDPRSRKILGEHYY